MKERKGRFPSLSERSSFLTVTWSITWKGRGVMVSISFREKFLPDRISQTCWVSTYTRQFPSLSEGSSFLTKK
ncbi:hypothetical protein, partial [Fervidobacterium thailandense]|uniref:hypothetical protein n=1 Tax=Fervidobacterium thailandense TaxID=1008305 RepID=UPI0019D364D9